MATDGYPQRNNLPSRQDREELYDILFVDQTVNRIPFSIPDDDTHLITGNPEPIKSVVSTTGCFASTNSSSPAAGDIDEVQMQTNDGHNLTQSPSTFPARIC